MTRRHWLWVAASAGAGNALPLRAALSFSTPPFALGVASGEPSPTGIVLWTRLAPKPLEKDGGMPMESVEVAWEIAEDERFSLISRRGKAVANPQLAHSVHVEADGLKPGRLYWYRFQAGSERSPSGRFRTAPAAGATPPRLRLAVASCQQWTQGLWTAYQHMADEDLDLVLHLGDYIYEQEYRGTVRSHLRGETYSLDDYRHRHALYKTDPLLQRAHASFAWSVTWDDHEVSNNYANDIQEDGDPREAFLERRASAYQAYYEHMPLRRAQLPSGSRMALYRRLDFGNLLRIHILDTRQYRTDQPCGDGRKPFCEDARDPRQTLLGEQQEQWLAQGLARSPAKWNALGQQIMMTFQDFDPGEGEQLNMDSWSGYEVARDRAVEAMTRASNPVVLTGDVHANWTCEVRQDPRDPVSRFVAPEFVATSISSGGDGSDTMEAVQKMLPANPQVRFFNRQRGYLRCEVTPAHWKTDYRVVEYVTRPGSPIKTRVSFTSEAGRGVPQPS